LVNHYFSGQQGSLTPACRVEPVIDDDVAFIYNTIVTNKCPFAVRSGGHLRTPGSSSVDGGVLIDLARLNAVDIAEDEQSVTIGGGCTWVDVYRAVEAEGLSVVGGRVDHVGVGGLLTGGMK
jgi:FAD/FMN-containing dehydrogenase